MKVRQEYCFIFLRDCTQNALWLLLTSLSLITGLGWEHFHIDWRVEGFTQVKVFLRRN